MAARAHSLIILFILIAFSSFKSTKSFKPSKPCGISIYWGQNVDEGSLQEACNSGNYQYVNIAFLATFGNGQKPVLDLGIHYDPVAGGLNGLSDEMIRFCQDKGIKVLLSIGGPSGTYSLSSPDDAKGVATYLWDNFLAGKPGGPLGNVALDGIDFDIEFPVSTLYWDVLVRALADYSTPTRKIFLSAAQQCPYCDQKLGPAIQTGLFDYVSVEFYNNSACDYRSGASGILRAWSKWSWSIPPNTQLLLGLLASPQGGGGYAPPGVILDQILPIIKNSGHYGGVMLWDRLLDLKSGYSSQIYSAVCTDTDMKLLCEGFCFV